MVEVYDYGLPEFNEEEIYDNPNEEGICDYPKEDDVMATEKVEITPNPAYGTVTCSKEHACSNE